jgi:hypothetical protein
MLETWLAKYPEPFVRPSLFVSPGAKPQAPPSPETMRQTLGAFLERATVKAAPQFGPALVRMSDRLAELTATAVATAPREEPQEDLDNSAPEDFSGSDEELLKEYQALDLLKVPFTLQHSPATAFLHLILLFGIFHIFKIKIMRQNCDVCTCRSRRRCWRGSSR